MIIIEKDGNRIPYNVFYEIVINIVSLECHLSYIKLKSLDYLVFRHDKNLRAFEGDSDVYDFLEKNPELSLLKVCYCCIIFILFLLYFCLCCCCYYSIVAVVIGCGTVISVITIIVMTLILFIVDIFISLQLPALLLLITLMIIKTVIIISGILLLSLLFIFFRRL